MSLHTLPPAMTTTPTPGVSPRSPTRAWRGPIERARRDRLALLGLLTATAFLYLWGLGSSGWANSFYSAAAQAGSESWKALFFGSSDAANSITVDKPPAALWVMGLSVRVFGLSSWSILVPEALMGVASVALLYGTVKRAVQSTAAGLISGAVLAATPVAALMFRFNNPDALLVLLMIGAASATLRAVQATWVAPQSKRAMRWLGLAGALIGFAFLTKMLQAFLVLPGLGLAYLLLAGRRYGYLKRLRDLAVALAALIVAAGWWVATVALWPASDRPYIGGSQHNSILELTLGYNGFGRLDGNETGSVGGGGGGAGGGWGATGLLRMLGSDVGGQVGWLLPASLTLLAAGLWLALRGRLAGAAAALVMWGGWLLVTATTFSLMQGIFHPYYTVALAPAIAAVVGIAVVLLWRHRAEYPVGLVMALATAVAAITAFVLLGRTPDFLPWLPWVVIIVGVVAALLLGAVRHLPRAMANAVASVALIVALAGPMAYSVETAETAHTGSIPSAGPAVAGLFGAGPRAGFTGRGPVGGPGGLGGPGGGPVGRPAGGPFGGNAPGGNPPGGAAGGLLDSSTPSAALVKALEADSSSYTWVAAAVGSQNASGYQLATRLPVMAIGGFNGSDPSPTLAQFKAWVAAGRIHYFISSGFGGMGRFGATTGSSSSSLISTWVTSRFPSKVVGGVTLYDLSGGTR